MRDDWRYEVERAMDLLPHVAGASWAAVWFRCRRVRDPSPEEFRLKTAEYFDMLLPLFCAYPEGPEFAEIAAYLKGRAADERRRIVAGENKEVEKRLARYADYG